MILYPAIDLKDGACVRLLHGAMDAATVYNRDAAAQARAFAEAGAEWIHVVDLDGAVAGRPVNEAAIEAILGATSLSVQLGGGNRSLEIIERRLQKGVRRVVLGTVALTNPALVREACRRFPGRIAIGIDARGGRVAVDGWVKTSETTALELAKALEDAGAAALVYTNIDRDGAKKGVDIAGTAALARAVATPVIASGGVASLDDLAALRAEKVIAGVIIGRALYDGAIDLREALRC
ncbi:MAG: 1-(5-phosphoribosyl)-5-[(5-phosphoribosylamino)methylideneamino]imidazole-4-carboxamide isomerase [Rhodospirillales bacterium]|nr:1-(5-phosphoribosyl)-5-[(5-phosphoribosylamino)methylideneamino]imidazole-4-carboxamide isomerase [Rhodospirillales bacterium]